MLIRKVSFLVFALLASAVAYAGTQRALLIGVSEYEANLTPLAGARNDVLIIRELLVQKYGFQPSNIRIMLDQEATRAQIISAIEQLADSAAPDDIVFIHYSGHGSQAPDDTGDEPDGFDETIVPHDARTPGVADITDDELNRLVGRIEAQSIVVILDSCHSGTGTRSGPGLVTQRWIAPDNRKDLYRSPKTRQVLTLPVSERHVFFAAAQDFESELDGPFGPDNLRLGLFTAAMVGVLVNSPADITPRAAIAGIGAQIEGLKMSAAGMPIPEPNMEAPLEKQARPMFVFVDDAPPVVPETTPAQFQGSGSQYYRPMKALYATTNGMHSPELARQVANSLGVGTGVARSLEDADAVIDAVGQGRFDVYGPAGVIQVADDLASGNTRSDYRFLEGTIRNAPALADLVSLDNPGSGLQLTMRAAGVNVVRSERTSTRAVKVSVNTANHRLRYYEEGEPRTRQNSLQLEISSNRSCYLSLASLDSYGDTYLLFPNIGQEESGFFVDGRIPGDRTVLIPDTLDDQNSAGFHFDYAPPGGVDRVVATCFSSLAGAERFREQVRKLERGEVLDAPVVPVATRGLTNITPGSVPVAHSQSSQPSPGTPGTPVNPGWAATILSLDVGLN